MNEQDKVFAIPQKLAEDILNYLGQRPFVEVFEIIAALQQIKPLDAHLEQNGQVAAEKHAE